MDVKIIEAPAWYVIGMGFYGDPFDKMSGWQDGNEIGRLWQRFIDFFEQDPTQIKHRLHPEALLEIHRWDEVSMQTGAIDVFVGAAVARLEEVPLACTIKALPATQYAICTLVGEQITSDWNALIYQDWLASSGYRNAYDYNIQYYDERFKGVDQIADSILDVYVPVKKV